jgi:hypothetical protein
MLMLLHGRDKRGMHVAKFDDAVGLTGSDRKDLCSRSDPRRHGKAANECDEQ